MSKQELRNEDGELLSVTEGLRTCARHLIQLCDDLWSKYTSERQPERANHVRIMRDEAQKALEISETPLDWLRCPCCDADLGETGDFEAVEIEQGDAFQKISCNKCEASWGEWYRADERVVYDYGKDKQPTE